MRKLLLSLVVLPPLALFSLNVTAAESTDWLINNPVSMMDWGSAKAKESAQGATEHLNEDLWSKGQNRMTI